MEGLGEKEAVAAAPEHPNAVEYNFGGSSTMKG